jgi:hypothetical protein
MWLRLLGCVVAGQWWLAHNCGKRHIYKVRLQYLFPASLPLGTLPCLPVSIVSVNDLELADLQLILFYCRLLSMCSCFSHYFQSSGAGGPVTPTLLLSTTVNALCQVSVLSPAVYSVVGLVPFTSFGSSAPDLGSSRATDRVIMCRCLPRQTLEAL